MALKSLLSVAVETRILFDTQVNSNNISGSLFFGTLSRLYAERRERTSAFAYYLIYKSERKFTILCEST